MENKQFSAILIDDQQRICMEHPTLGTFVRSDGAVYLRIGGRSKRRHWTYGGLDSDGYPRVHIARKTRKIHILEAETFIPNPENKPTVDHINRVRSDNRVFENLRWATHKEQTENSKCVLERADYGVREIEDKKAYMKEYNKEYYQKHKEYALSYRKEYYTKHRDEIIRKSVEYKRKKASQNGWPSLPGDLV